MSLRQQLETDIKAALKAGETRKKDVLRVVLGEVQAQESRTGKPASDDDVIKVMRKTHAGLLETKQMKARSGPDIPARLTGFDTEAEEMAILDAYLPQQLDADSIKGELLNSDGPEFEQIQNAKSEGQGVGIAMKFLKAKGLAADGSVVKQVVADLRAYAEDGVVR